MRFLLPPFPTLGSFWSDAFGDENVGGIAGWAPPPSISYCEDMSSLHGFRWFGLEFAKGDIVSLGDISPQKIVAPLELLGQLVAFHLFIPNSDSAVPTQTDSMVVSGTLQRFRCKSLAFLTVLRAAAWYCIRQNIWSCARHLAGLLNHIADKLSRPSEYPEFQEHAKSVGHQVHIDCEFLGKVLSIPCMSDVEDDVLRLRTHVFVIVDYVFNSFAKFEISNLRSMLLFFGPCFFIIFHDRLFTQKKVNWFRILIRTRRKRIMKYNWKCLSCTTLNAKCLKARKICRTSRDGSSASGSSDTFRAAPVPRKEIRTNLKDLTSSASSMGSVDRNNLATLIAREIWV